MNTKQKGDIGVAQAIAYYTRAGHVVSYPLTDNAKYDLVVEVDGELKKVQCKYTAYKRDDYIVELRTMGGNASWNKVYGYVDADLLFVADESGKMFEFPKQRFSGKSSITLSAKVHSLFGVS